MYFCLIETEKNFKFQKHARVYVFFYVNEERPQGGGMNF